MKPKLAPGHRAPEFSLPSTDGTQVLLSKELTSHKAILVAFICNHCPYVQAYIPRLIELQKKFAGKVRFIGINSNDPATYAEDSPERMKEYAAEWKLNFPYLHDATQSVARAYGAERTPEIFLLDAQGVCVYEGGIDDNYKEPSKVTQRPLREAIEAVLAGEPVPTPRTYAIGCTIKWSKG